MSVSMATPPASESKASQSNATMDLLPPRGHLEKFGFLFGAPIMHSMSPLFHQTIYDGLGLKWQQFFFESATVTDCLPYFQDPNFYGAAVTMPHKVNIIPHLDELAEEARACGACNTVYLKQSSEGKRILVGTNTDVIGVRESFLQNIPEASRTNVYGQWRPGMVIGGGGAARAAVYALVRQMGISTVYLVNRDRQEVEVLREWCNAQGYGDGLVHIETLEQAKSSPDVGAIVACVPDIAPVSDAEKTVRAILLEFLERKHKGAILEMAYHPKPWTAVAQIATDLQWQVLLGTEAMIYQGLAQDQFWTGRALEDLPVEKVKSVIADALAKAVPH